MRIIKKKVRDTKSEPAVKRKRAILRKKPRALLSAKRLRDLERRFAKTSGLAFAKARKQTLVSGQSVLQSEDGIIFEVFPDGTRHKIKEIEKPTQVKRGLRLAIR